MAAQLARLAIWIHPFVPGLPLSLLDRNLVHGNSLVGAGRLSVLEEKLREDGDTPWVAKVEDFVGDASEALYRFGRIADATSSEIRQARKAWSDADSTTAPAKAVCDILSAARIEGVAMSFHFSRWEEKKRSVVGGKEHRHPLELLGVCTAGRSFDLCEPLSGPVYAWMEPPVAVDHYHAKRVNGSGTGSSGFHMLMGCSGVCN